MARPRRPSPHTVLVLGALAREPSVWRYGYDLSRETGLASGTLYPLLMWMTDQGLVEAEWQAPTQPGRPPRHAYRLTTAGLQFARKVQDVGGAPSGVPLPA